MGHFVPPKNVIEHNVGSLNVYCNKNDNEQCFMYNSMNMFTNDYNFNRQKIHDNF